MGNSPDSKSFHTSLEFFEKNYIKVAKKTDPCYGEGVIFKDRLAEKEVFLKEEFFFDSSLYKRKLSFLKSECERPHPSMVRIIGFTSSSEEQFCSKHFKCYVVFDYLTTSLVQDTHERRKNEFFLAEQEIWKRIETLIYGFSYMQEKGVNHGKINLRNILVEEGGLKILNTSFLNSCNAYAKLLTQTNDKGEELFLSPKLMQALKENEWQPNHDPFKSDVFCLGISFLEMITLKSSSSIFDFQKHLIFDDEIISTINEIKEMYSTGLGNFIQNMLYINEEKRKNFIELRLLLEKRHIQEDSIQKNGKVDGVTLIESKVKDFLSTPSKSISTNYDSMNLGSPLSRIKEREFQSQKSLSNQKEGLNTGMLIKSRIKRCPSPHTYQKALSFFNYGTKVMEYIEEKEKEFAEIKRVTIKEEKKFPEEETILSLQNIKSKDINLEKHGDTVNSSIKKNWKDVEQNFQPVISIRESSMVSLDFELARPLELKSNYNKYEIVVERYEDNSFYEGEKIDDEKMGKGRFTYSDGSFYDGEWSHNKKNGIGAFIYKNKSPIYIGSWKHDRFNGKGVLFNIYIREEGVVDWVKFEGDFDEGRKKGRGILFLNNGERREENN